jgi:phospholipid/cholesterol/gamma-HCH transport system substrate-binding protein
VIKTIPTAKRLAAMIIFTLTSFGGLLYLWLAFGGSIPLKPEGYRFNVRFPEATQLGAQADVRISGVSVGKVVRIAPSSGNRTRATIQLQPRYAPIPRDAKAILRLKTLLGETYVELTPGTRSGPTLPEGGALSDAAVSKTVELDEILRTFDPQTREAFQTWMQAQAGGVEGRGADINATLGQFPGFVEKFDDLFAMLDAQRSATAKTVSQTAEVFDAISAREGELRGLVADSQRLFSVTGKRNRDLAAIFQALPRFERESTRTLPLLTAFGERADPVVRQLQPAADEMAPTFDALRELSPQLDGVFSQLGDVVDASKAGLPAFEQILGDIPPLLSDFSPFLRNANPIVDYIGRNKREVTAFFANLTGASLARDVGGLDGTTDLVHYLRTSQTLSPEGLALYPRPLGMSREDAYLKPGRLDQLAQGLPVLSTTPCAFGDVVPPASSDPPTLTPMVQKYVFRTPGRDAARPACRPQGAFPGFGTVFPQLRAEP